MNLATLTSMEPNARKELSHFATMWPSAWKELSHLASMFKADFLLCHQHRCAWLTSPLKQSTSPKVLVTNLYLCEVQALKIMLHHFILSLPESWIVFYINYKTNSVRSFSTVLTVSQSCSKICLISFPSISLLYINDLSMINIHYTWWVMDFIHYSGKHLHHRHHPGSLW